MAAIENTLINIDTCHMHCDKEALETWSCPTNAMVRPRRCKWHLNKRAYEQGCAHDTNSRTVLLHRGARKRYRRHLLLVEIAGQAAHKYSIILESFLDGFVALLSYLLLVEVVRQAAHKDAVRRVHAARLPRQPAAAAGLRHVV